MKTTNFNIKNIFMKMIYATPLTRYVIVTYFALIIYVRSMSLAIK